MRPESGYTVETMMPSRVSLEILVLPGAGRAQMSLARQPAQSSYLKESFTLVR
jgi:hypothetical protein